MGAKQVATFAAVSVAALAALTHSAPLLALEPLDMNSVPQATMFYVSIPLGATTAKQAAPAYGLAFQGKRQFETVRLDSSMFNFSAAGMLAGIETKWLVVGGIAVAGVAAVALKNKNRSETYNTNQNNQQANAPTNGGGSGGGSSDPNKPCPLPNDPCHK